MKQHWLCMKEKWGQNLKRYAILFFSEHVFLTDLGKNHEKREGKNTHCSLFVGALLSALKMMLLSAS